ncbi:MAG: pilus assembly protein N-terminal domain-containing protein, partial [Armatimonadota bacterium]|nr:pilus assembly protein N-terminal domain-containing protein [Armatimonadota bacterium]
MMLKYKGPRIGVQILVLLAAAIILSSVAAGAVECTMGKDCPMGKGCKMANDCTMSSKQQVELVIATGTSALLPCQGLTKVAVGDPAVADVVPVSTATLLINGKAVGSTNLYIWDRYNGGRLRDYKVSVVSSQPNLIAAACKISEEIGCPAISCKPVGDSIFLEGVVADAEMSKRAEAIARAHSKNISNLIRVEKTAASSKSVVKSLQTALTGTGLTVRALADGAVLVEGKVANQATLDRVNAILQSWTKDTRIVNLVEQLPLPSRQVMIRAQVVEINRSNLKDLGVDWG